MCCRILKYTFWAFFILLTVITFTNKTMGASTSLNERFQLQFKSTNDRWLCYLIDTAQYDTKSKTKTGMLNFGTPERRRSFCLTKVKQSTSKENLLRYIGETHLLSGYTAKQITNDLVKDIRLIGKISFLGMSVDLRQKSQQDYVVPEDKGLPLLHAFFLPFFPLGRIKRESKWEFNIVLQNFYPWVFSGQESRIEYKFLCKDIKKEAGYNIALIEYTWKGTPIRQTKSMDNTRFAEITLLRQGKGVARFMLDDGYIISKQEEATITIIEARKEKKHPKIGFKKRRIIKKTLDMFLIAPPMISKLSKP